MIERRTPIRRDTPRTRAWANKPRKPIPKVGRKRRREADAVSEFREALIARARGRCEASGLVDMTGQRICGRIGPHDGTDPHHVWPEDHDRSMHVPSRGLWLCRAAHDWAHFVAGPGEASALGLLRPCEMEVTINREPTDEQAIAAAAMVYAEHPEVRSFLLHWPLGRLVVAPPGVTVEWRA